MKIERKIMSSVIAVAILLTSIPTMVFAEGEDIDTPNTPVETSIQTFIEEQPTETTVEETVDENTKTIPSDETEPTTETVEDIEEPPIEETAESSETEKPTETTGTTVTETTQETKATESSETTVETTEPSESTTETTVTETSKIITAKSYDEYFELISKLPEAERIIVDTEKDLSMLTVKAGVYFDGTYILSFENGAEKAVAVNTLANLGISYSLDGELSTCDNDEEDWSFNGIGEDDDTLPDDWEYEDTECIEEEILDMQINPNAKTRIAIIDTGSNKANESYSVIGDSVTDDNGHGTEMANLVLNGSNDAYIISIKALDKDGHGQMTGVYAAVQLAESMNVDYILLAMSIRDNGKYNAFKELITNTKAKVITSAGNNGTDAKKYLPASIENAYVVGAIDYETTIRDFSNYGSTVDYYMVADSTSAASAKVAGLMIAGETEINKYADIDSEHYYYEGSEYEFEADTRGNPKYYFAADAKRAGKNYTQFRSLMLNFAKDQKGKNQPNGCIDLAMHAMNYAKAGKAVLTGDNAFKSIIWNNNKVQINNGKYFDFSSTGCTTFMKSRAGISAAAKIGVYNLKGSGAGSKYISANISNGKKLYNYCKDYAKPGDIIIFSNENKWVHAAIYAGTVTGSKSEMYAAEYRPGIVVWESPGVGKAVRKRIISAADFAVKDAEKKFTTAVIIKAAPDNVTMAFTISKSVPAYCTQLMATANSASVYSFEGTKYGLFSSPDCTEDTLLTEFILGVDGKTDDKFDVKVGTTYYLREIFAGPGLNLSPEVITLTINSNTSATFNGKTIAISNGVFTGDVEDIPIFDPIYINLRKVDSFGKPVNGATMTGATFILEYYSEDLGDPNAADAETDTDDLTEDPDDGEVDTGDPLEEGEEDPDQPIEDIDTTISPKVIYRITLDGTGRQQIRLSTLQALEPIGGTDPNCLKNLNNNTNGQYPLGTYRLYEDTAPSGYTKNEQVIRIRLYQDPEDPDHTIAQYLVETATGNSRYWNHTLNGEDMSLVLAEAPEIGYYELTKSIPVNGYDLSGFEFELWNKTENIQIATGVSQANGKVLWTYVVEGYKSNVDPTITLTGTTTEKLELALGPSDNRIEYEVREKIKTDAVNEAGIPISFKTATVEGKTVTNGTGYYSISETLTENGTTVSRVFTNPVEYVNLSIRKSDTSNDATARTFTFDVFWLGNGATANESASKKAGTISITTNTAGEGIGTLEGLPLGWYKVVETDTNGLKVTYPNGQIIDGRTDGAKLTFDVVNSVQPSIGTTLIDGTTNEHIGTIGENITLTDTVSYKGLFAGTYTVKGTLMNKATNEPLKINGNTVTAETTFTLNAQTNAYGKEIQQSGTVDVTFTFNTTTLKNIAVVAFEELYLGNELIAEHKDINDEGQTVYFPEIHTTLLTVDTNVQVAVNDPTKPIVLKDIIYYNNLVPNKTYKVSGILVSRTDNGAETTYVGEKEFIPTTASGTTEVEFTIPAGAASGKILVAYETLSFNGKNITVDNDINNEAETIYIPEIKTTLVDKDTGEHITSQNKTITLTDTVKYTALKPNVEYNMLGTLMDKETGEAIKDSNGAPIQANTKFTPTTSDGTVDVVFTFKNVELKSKTIVAFEVLQYQGQVVATHSDIDDVDQTVFVPDIHTTFYDASIGEKNVGDGSSLASYGKTVKLIDRVYYENVVPGLKYTVTGTVMVKATEKALLDADNKPYTVTVEFTPTAATGYVDVEIEVDTTRIPNISLVCFETLKYGTVELVIHNNINDVDQTVNIPELQTTATDKADGDKMVDGTKKTQTIVDVVKYTNLIPNKEYTITGKIAVKKDYKDGEETEYVKNTDGDILTVSKTFTPTEANGSETLEFTFDATKYAGYQVVVFEDLYFNNIQLAMHADIEDEDQTIDVSLLLHVKIAKMDGKKIKYVLKNAEITIYQAQLDANGELVKDEKGNVIYTVVKDVNGKDCIGVTDETGTVEFTILWNRNYKYFAKETVAPRGYYLNNDYFEVVPTDSRESDGVCLIPITIYDFVIPPKTGDSMNIGLYAALACVALAVVAGGTVFLINKKKNKNESDDSK